MKMVCKLFFALTILFCVVALTSAQNCPYGGFPGKHLTTKQGREGAAAALRITLNRRYCPKKRKRKLICIIKFLFHFARD